MASDIFIKIGDIKGESKDKTHKDEVEVMSWSFGMSQSGSMAVGGGGSAGKVSFQNLSFTHGVDTASPNLMQHCASGKHIGEVKLTARKAGETQHEFVVIKLTDVIVTSVQLSGADGSGAPTESVTLDFAKIQYDYKAQKADGTLDAPIKFGWDQKENVKV
jgi:type VI secretion system secreted protein Hcp